MNALRQALTACAVVAILSACGSQSQPPGPNAQITMLKSSDVASPLTDKLPCGGTKHVRVRPCPVTVGPPSVVEVTISGPGVVRSKLPSCGGNICTVSQLDGTHWNVYPGSGCGSNLGYGKGLDSNGKRIGVGFLLISKPCR